MMISKIRCVIGVMAVWLATVISLGLTACQSESLCLDYCTSKDYDKSYETRDKCNCYEPKEKRVIYFNRTQALGDFEEI